MILQPYPHLSTDDFTFTRGTFVAEDSTLFGPLNAPGGLAKRGLNGMGQVYDDACDIGFTLVSGRTGKPAVFAFSGTDRVEDEVAGWRFTCVTPGLKHLDALIIND